MISDLSYTIYTNLLGSVSSPFYILENTNSCALSALSKNISTFVEKVLTNDFYTCRIAL